MQETLITFETAKLALERGFDEYTNSCIGLIHKDTVYVPSEFGLQLEVHVLYGVLNNSRMDEFNSDYISQPTQSLLQKWLREVHNIYVECYHDLTSDGKNIRFYTSWGFLQQKDINGVKNVNGWYDEYNDWKTYEEALELGLQESLKLIKTNESRED